MAKIPVKYRAPVWAVMFNLAVVVGIPGTAWAVQAVIDSTAVAKLTAQVNKLQEQLETLKAVKDGVQDQIDAVGKMGQITLPGVDLQKMAAGLRRDMQCLKPDLSKLMPSLDFKDIRLGSICDVAPVYRETLWLSPARQAELPSLEARTAAREQVERRRKNVFVDSVSKAMAHADVAAQDVEDTNAAANELESALASSATSNDRLQAIGQGQVLIARALAKQNQLLAQLLKVQATFAMEAGASVNGIDDPDGENRKKP